ncbi:MAG TPA: type III pantothenate kinase [Clostridiales bacterium]|nr:type III pantothenate kinase [Clostridiales bacterium]
MILTIDIGNTNITFACYENNILKCVSRLETNRSRTGDQYAVEFRQILILDHVDIQKINGAVISSVVPELTRTLVQTVEKLIGITPIVLAPKVKNGLDIKIDNPAELGADMVASAVAALNKYDLPCLIADLGTATKISVLDEKGVFRGCSIAPGVDISLNALSGGTSQLPALALETPKCAIGTNTIASIRSGVVYGTAAMLDGMFDRMEAELGTKVKTFVATGGYSKDIITHCSRKIIYDEYLVLEGLLSIHEKNN